MEADGVTKTEITSEGAEVQEIAVSPAGGSRAFVSKHQLYQACGQYTQIV